MRFQDLPLPNKENKLGETSWLTEVTVLKPILNKHMAPKGKVGLVIVKEGTLDYVWEDRPEDIITADKYHPIVIEPERYHHIVITGEVVFKIEFYKDKESNVYDESAVRPGEAFVK